MPFLGKSSREEPSLFGGDFFSASNAAKAIDASASVEVRHSCGSSECSGGWIAPWRNRMRPIFEGQWGCSRRCVQAMVRSAVRREIGDGLRADDDLPHRHRIPLGLVMLAQGWITHPQLQKALELQRASGTGRIGDWLVQECGLGMEHIARGLSVQWSCPVLDSAGFSPSTMTLAMPRLFAEEFGAVPLHVAGNRMIYVAFEDHLDASVALAVERMSDLKVESGLLEMAKFKVARSQLLECDGVRVTAESVSGRDAMVEKVATILDQKLPFDARLVRVHQYYWLRLWLESGTTGRAGRLPLSSEDMLDYVFEPEMQ